MLNRLFIFDLDGVLIDSKFIHYYSLNEALSKIDNRFIISEKEHLDIFEGLTTKNKLNILSSQRGLETSLHNQIWQDKQKISSLLFKNTKIDKDLIEIFKLIKSNNIKIAVASNSIRETVYSILQNLGVIEFIDCIVSNEDVDNPKPNPEMYLKCVNLLNSTIENTTIFEDSLVGKMGAFRSGCKIISIENRKQISKDFIEKIILNNKKNINVLIPMAGDGARFSAAGFDTPKPFININGKTMIQTVVENIGIDARYIFIIKKEHMQEYNVVNHISSFCKEYTIVIQDNKIDGAALTTMLAKELIDNEDHLLIANCDQYVSWEGQKQIDQWINSGVDGAILTFNSNNKKWSYAKHNEYNVVEQVAEKMVISNSATVGIYYWNKGSDYIKYCNKMIEKNIRVNNEFYVCPVFNEAILENKIIIKTDVKKMQGLGTPEDLYLFLKGTNL